MGHLLGYARVSTTDQQPQLQVDALQRAGCYRVFVETASGARSDRPALAQLLDQLRPGDTLVVWKLDRLGRSLRHLVDTITGLADRGIGLRSLQEAIDTTTPGGKLVFHVFAALAEFERDLIRERTTAGLVAARDRGGDRRGPGRESRLHLPAPHRRQQLTNSSEQRAGCWRTSRMTLTSCMPYTDLRLHHGRLRLSSCGSDYPWGTVIDRC
jgi:DNA invertase Pin-like site-specific DNA recombinase